MAKLVGVINDEKCDVNEAAAAAAAFPYISRRESASPPPPRLPSRLCLLNFSLWPGPFLVTEGSGLKVELTFSSLFLRRTRSKNGSSGLDHVSNCVGQREIPGS